MRFVWSQAGLMLSPFDRLVKVENVQAAREGYVVSLLAQKGTHRIQLAGLGREIDHVLLDGRPQAIIQEAEGSISIESNMDGKHQLSVRLR